MDTSGRFFAARNKDKRVKSPFQATRRIQSRMKGSKWIHCNLLYRYWEWEKPKCDNWSNSHKYEVSVSHNVQPSDFEDLCKPVQLQSRFYYNTAISRPDWWSLSESNAWWIPLCCSKPRIYESTNETKEYAWFLSTRRKQSGKPSQWAPQIK